jgi:hypothetical protein
MKLTSLRVRMNIYRGDWSKSERARDQKSSADNVQIASATSVAPIPDLNDLLDEEQSI